MELLDRYAIQKRKFESIAFNHSNENRKKNKCANINVNQREVPVNHEAATENQHNTCTIVNITNSTINELRGFLNQLNSSDK